MSQPQEITEPMAQAMGAVVLFYNELSTVPTGARITIDMVRLMWFSQTPMGWTAMLTTTLTDGLHYEVIYDDGHGETTINCYKKLDSVKMPIMGFGC